MSHSPEPWEACPSGALIDANRKVITQGIQECWIHRPFFSQSECRARYVEQVDIERIVACVNACKGIPTEALDRGTLPSRDVKIDVEYPAPAEPD